MREIKFRAWDGKKMLETHEIGVCEPDDAFGSNLASALNENGLTYMQYTGLKDKNGKEIYEGDVIGGYNPKYEKQGGPSSIVKWNEEEGCFGIYRGKTESGYVLSAEVKWNEVIGNIYENKELLV